MHWVADASGLASTGSVFPGYPDHIDGAERRAWRVAAERQWERLLEMRALELARGGRFVAALPASTAPCPERRGLYVELIGDMNRLLADWRRTGRIGAATVAAVVVPVWMRTLDEIRRPFEERGGSVAGLELESAELFRSGQSLLARRSRRLRAGICAERDRMGGPAAPPGLRERGRGPRPRSPRRLSRRARGARRGCPRPLPLGLHRGPRHLPEGGWQRAPPDALMKLASLPNGARHTPHLTQKIRLRPTATHPERRSPRELSPTTAARVSLVPGRRRSHQARARSRSGRQTTAGSGDARRSALRESDSARLTCDRPDPGS